MKLILHIGTEKTATTSIQQFLYKNRKPLSRHGFHLSDAIGKPNNRAFAQCFAPENLSDDFFKSLGMTHPLGKAIFRYLIKRRLKREIRKAQKDPDCSAYIITSEHFHSRVRNIEDIYSVKYFLDTLFDDVHVVVYLREQFSMACSAYHTAVLAGSTRSFRDFLTEICVISNDAYNHHQTLSKWATVFGAENINPRLYEKHKFHDGNILKDFLNTIGLADHIDEFDCNEPNLNKSIGVFGLELGVLANQLFPAYYENGIPASDRYQIIRAIKDSDISELGGKLDTSLANKIYDDFSSSNKSLGQEFFKTTDNPFQMPASPQQSAEKLKSQVPVSYVYNLWNNILITKRKTGRMGALNKSIHQYYFRYKTIKAALQYFLSPFSR